jgi:hypothetical protein
MNDTFIGTHNPIFEVIQELNKQRQKYIIKRRTSPTQQSIQEHDTQQSTQQGRTQGTYATYKCAEGTCTYINNRREQFPHQNDSNTR